MAVAAVCVAQTLIAQIEVPTECCLQVYDFKASIKNSNIGQKYDKKCGIGYCYKLLENNTLGGYLVTTCSACCEQGGSRGWLYLYRQNDKAKRLFRVHDVFLSADQFFAKLVDCSEPVSKFAAGTADAEGLLGFYALGRELDTFFTHDDDTVIDVGNKAFLATGYGKSVTQSIYDPVLCKSFTCSVLDSLSGSIVGLLELGSVCGNAPYEVLCTGALTGETTDGWSFANPYGANAVATGTWSIKRNTKLAGCDLLTIQKSILAKLRGYTLLLNDPVNIAPLATATSSGGGTGNYGPTRANNGLVETDEPCGTWGWIEASNVPGGRWIQYEWPSPVSVYNMHMDTQSGTTTNHCGNVGRTLGYAEVQWWNGSGWITDGIVTNQLDDWDYTFTLPVTTTRVRLFNIYATNLLGQSSNPIVFEWEVFTRD